MRIAPIVAAAFFCAAPAANAAVQLCSSGSVMTYCVQPDETIEQMIAGQGPQTSYTVTIDYKLTASQEVEPLDEGNPLPIGLVNFTLHASFTSGFGTYAVMDSGMELLAGMDSYDFMVEDQQNFTTSDPDFLAAFENNVTIETLVSNFYLAVEPGTYDGALKIPTLTASVIYTIVPTNVTTAVPEPATWAMMIAGFGLTGAAMRRRHRAVGRQLA